jgi:hypothetical protein
MFQGHIWDTIDIHDRSAVDELLLTWWLRRYAQARSIERSDTTPSYMASHMVFLEAGSDAQMGPATCVRVPGWELAKEQCVLLYHYNTRARKVRVYGFVMPSTLRETHGYVYLQQLRRDEKTLLLPWEEQSLEAATLSAGEEPEWDRNAWIRFPYSAHPTNPVLNMDDVERRVLMLQDVYDRAITNYGDQLAFRYLDGSDFARYLVAHPDQEIASRVACVQIAVRAPNFEAMRRRAELAFFNWRVARFMTGPAAWAHTWAQNGRRAVDTTPLDHWHSGQTGLVFPIPYEESTTTALCMHPGGVAHLAATDLPAWLLARFRQMDRTVRLLDDTTEPLYDGRIDHVVGLAMHISKPRFEGLAMQVGDIEDLVVAPCLRRVIDNRSRFPKHSERFPLARALRSAGVTLEQADVIFTKLAEPGATKQQVRGRHWNWRSVWDKKMINSYCDDYIDNARHNVPDSLRCAFAHAENPTLQCQKEFAKLYPGKTKQTDRVTVPSQWTMWFHMRQNK